MYIIYSEGKCRRNIVKQVVENVNTIQEGIVLSEMNFDF